eukprot:scaffold104898_cov60-Phaeocystis_antarctica.AAC.2
MSRRPPPTRRTSMLARSSFVRANSAFALRPTTQSPAVQVCSSCGNRCASAAAERRDWSGLDGEAHSNTGSRLPVGLNMSGCGRATQAELFQMLTERGNLADVGGHKCPYSKWTASVALQPAPPSASLL